MIVDCRSLNGTGWLDDVFGLVAPEDVRWVFLSHDDADHTANVGPVMEACPEATLVCSWALVERFANAYEFPLSRCRRVNHEHDYHHLGAQPVIDAEAVETAFDMMANLAGAQPPPCPDQSVLEALLGAGEAS